MTFYHWLTMKNEQTEDVKQDESGEELEQILIQKPDFIQNMILPEVAEQNEHNPKLVEDKNDRELGENEKVI